jgi:hypothetical protein
MYALVLIDISPRFFDKLELLRFLENIEENEAQETKDSKILEGVWLIDLSRQLSFLCKILREVQGRHLSYRVSFFENKPEFII